LFVLGIAAVQIFEKIKVLEIIDSNEKKNSRSIGSSKDEK
jgi:hypothetical protein